MSTDQEAPASPSSGEQQEGDAERILVVSESSTGRTGKFVLAESAHVDESGVLHVVRPDGSRLMYNSDEWDVVGEKRLTVVQEMYDDGTLSADAMGQIERGHVPGVEGDDGE